MKFWGKIPHVSAFIWPHAGTVGKVVSRSEGCEGVFSKRALGGFCVQLVGMFVVLDGQSLFCQQIVVSTLCLTSVRFAQLECLF
mmetsp:Transcript_21608/g.47146  ORF Transcript_21608/g.47146 Transcript_21608/m.47146 type:complete len:84 (+) Transcript_21608:368-619(+)